MLKVLKTVNNDVIALVQRSLALKRYMHFYKEYKKVISSSTIASFFFFFLNQAFSQNTNHLINLNIKG